MPTKPPTVSIIIPTLNSALTIRQCLQSLHSQDWPAQFMEVLLIDGGSTDSTLNIAKKFPVKIFKNPLKSAEAAKAVGLKNAMGEYLLLLDSDNILPDENWLSKMLQTLRQNPDLIGAEPLYFTYRSQDGFIDRYCALLGANDPYAYFCGIYDRYSYLSQKWTSLPLEFINRNNFFEINLQAKEILPTIGANGTLWRKKILDRYFTGDYFFDIDILNQIVTAITPKVKFAKVKLGIIHLYCNSSITKFIKKQNRRVIDLYRYRYLRSYQNQQRNLGQQISFTFYSLSLVLPLVDSFKGFVHKPDPAWFFHPLACFLTFWIYFTQTLIHYFSRFPASKYKLAA